MLRDQSSSLARVIFAGERPTREALEAVIDWLRSDEAIEVLASADPEVAPEDALAHAIEEMLAMTLPEQSICSPNQRQRQISRTPDLGREAAVSWEIIDDEGHVTDSGAWDSATAHEIGDKVAALVAGLDERWLRIEVEG